jgi:hypothetical protein
MATGTFEIASMGEDTYQDLEGGVRARLRPMASPLTPSVFLTRR